MWSYQNVKLLTNLRSHGPNYPNLNFTFLKGLESFLWSKARAIEQERTSPLGHDINYTSLPPFLHLLGLFSISFTLFLGSSST
jgi:hypothetical protein